MLRLDARNALGQTLDAFDKRAGRTARRERFGRGTFGARRTLGAFCGRGLWRGLGCTLINRSGRWSVVGFNWRGGGRGRVLRFSTGRIFAGARGESFAAATTATASASARAAVCRWLVAG